MSVRTRAAVSAVWPAAFPLVLSASSLAGCFIDDPGDAPPPPADIAEVLATLEGVARFDEQVTGSPGYRRFRIAFEQPVDHDDPGGPTFDLELRLLHHDFDAPMVLGSTGYGSTGFAGDELTEMLGANQLVIEHRYFDSSRPEPTDWSHLTIAQAAADHHRVATAFAPFYTGPWVSAGASKGGMASVFHRRFYPDDVDATVAYVTPISFGVDDERYEPFFDTVGEPACRQKVRDFQRDALARLPDLEPLARTLARDRDLAFQRMGGIARALESGIVELEWGFWQYLGACDEVPDSTATDQEALAFLDRLGSLDNMSDQSLERYEPYHYQAFTEIGYPSIPADHLADLLQFGSAPNVEALLPAGVSATFDPAIMRDIADWVAAEGERILFVYGEDDPWTGGAVDPGNRADVLLFVAPDESHGAKIADLAASDMDRALDALADWTGTTLAAPRASAALRSDPGSEQELLRPPPRVLH